MSFWRGRNVFVTGGAGLLGSWLVEELLRSEAHVVCLLREGKSTGRLFSDGLIEHVGVVRGDLVEFDTLLSALNEFEIDSVFHLAAQAIVRKASRSALSTFESNIRGTWLLLEACCASARGVERVVVASSDKAYGAHDALPYTEETPLIARTPYEVSKTCTDLIATSYFHSFGIPVAVTRCGNLFGGGDLHWNRIVPGAIRSVLAGEAPVIRTDGTLVRDYFFVRDAVHAYLELAERVPEEGIVGGAFNFSSETPLSVIELVERLLVVMGRSDLHPKVLNEPCAEIPNQYLDCSKARRVLGWKSRYTLEEGLGQTVEWYRRWLSGHPSAGES